MSNLRWTCSLFADLAPRPTQNAGNPQRLPFPGSTHGYPARPPSVYASSTQQPALAGKQPPFGATGPSVNNNKPSHKKSCEYILIMTCIPLRRDVSRTRDERGFCHDDFVWDISVENDARGKFVPTGNACAFRLIVVGTKRTISSYESATTPLKTLFFFCDVSQNGFF